MGMIVVVDTSIRFCVPVVMTNIELRLGNVRASLRHIVTQRQKMRQTCIPCLSGVCQLVLATLFMNMIMWSVDLYKYI